MKRLLAAAAVLATFAHSAFAGEITLFGDADFRGSRVTLTRDVRNLGEVGLNDRVSSVVVRSGVWVLCEHADFGGRCAEFGPGEYPALTNFNDAASSVREVTRGRERDEWRGDRDGRRGDYRDDREDRGGRGDERGGGWRGQGRGGPAVLLFSDHRFQGQRFGTDRDEAALVDFNDRTSSIVIREGRWEFCDDAGYRGQCMVLGPGEYPSLDRLNDRISSMRRVR
jgi:hypothetical protein